MHTEIARRIPEDYISAQSRLRYVQYTESDPKVAQVYDCLHRTFPDNEVYKFFMDTTSEVFVDGNDRNLILFWSGPVDSGKSTIQKFVETILGDHVIKLSIPFNTSNSSTSPRLAIVQGIQGTDYINIRNLNRFIGNSSYESDHEINPMITMVVVCNELPRLPQDIGQETISRLRVIPFESTFSHTAPETDEEQLNQKIFPRRNSYIFDMVPELADAFLWVLIEHLRNRTEPSIPDKVRNATERYIQRNGHYR